jgi:hypothetical protein
MASLVSEVGLWHSLSLSVYMSLCLAGEDRGGGGIVTAAVTLHRAEIAAAVRFAFDCVALPNFESFQRRRRVRGERPQRALPT